MSGFFFSDDKGNKIFGQEDPTLKSIKDSAASGKKIGVDKTGFGNFPAPLVDPTSLPGSLGDWRTTTPMQFFPYPGVEAKSGFTKPLLTGVEGINYDKNKLKNSPAQTSENIKNRRTNYDYYEDYSSKQFTHLLDYFQDLNSPYGKERHIQNGQFTSDSGTTQPNTKDIYLGSYIRTTDDNEDPTMLGYDLVIKVADSPLFNKSIDSFIKLMSDLGNSEVGSRQSILDEFKTQFYRFIKNDESISTNSETFLGKSGVKTYYLKGIGGLDNLNETNDSNKIKSFVDYGAEFITLEFYEDVTQNIGYLASLYKMLSWSRINGKQIIPENLLRFDIDITITEIRKYNRVFKNVDNSVDVYADLISKYTYTLYECQFFFDKLPHGDSLDLSSPSLIDKYQFKFNYKYSTMKFTKFKLNSTDRVEKEITINNKYDNITRTTSKESLNSQISNGRIVTTPNTPKLNLVYSFSEENGKVPTTVNDKQGPTEDFNIRAKSVGRFEKAIQTLEKDLTNAVIREVNRQILTQASLLNRTLDNIRNAIPGAGRMSAPTNVYGDMSKNLFLNDLTNAARNFVGNSVKSFFTKP